MKKKLSQKKKKTGSIIAVVIIAAIIAVGVYYFNQHRISQGGETQWKNVSGPFAINKFQYKIGEYVFMIVSNLQPNEAGQIVIVDPKGDTYDTIPFNGSLKTSFHSMLKPNTQRGLKLCEPTDLVGNWGLIFQGVPYKPLKFAVVNDWINGSQSEIKAIPNC